MPLACELQCARVKGQLVEPRPSQPRHPSPKRVSNRVSPGYRGGGR
jgi:hypothetical protein